MNTEKRPPVVAILGHIDHGKSTLLDFIRHSNIVDNEAGGITQHISAYEIEHEDEEHGKQKITFIDTPGHEAFCEVRSRGANIADIAILIVSAEDGVMPQTKEALACIKKDAVPFIVAITKIDSPKANIDVAKNSLIENEVYLEGMGGDIPFVPISSKTGENVTELLSMILLVAELEELTADTSEMATGFVVEAHKDMKKGNSATVVIKNGTLETGHVFASETTLSPVRAIEDTVGVVSKTATVSKPVVIYGWSELPPVGAKVTAFTKKKEAEKFCKNCLQEKNASNDEITEPVAQKNKEHVTIPLIVKADVAGTAEAIAYEVGKLNTEDISFNIVQSATGDISEADMKAALANEDTIVVGMGVSIDTQATALKDRENITTATFAIIYELIDWLKELQETRRPRKEVEEATGTVKVLAIFNQSKKTQVIGGKVKTGEIAVGNKINILRRNEVIGTGTIKELQQSKMKAEKVLEGNEFGAALSTDVELAESDHFEAIKTTVV